MRRGLPLPRRLRQEERGNSVRRKNCFRLSSVLPRACSLTVRHRLYDLQQRIGQKVGMPSNHTRTSSILGCSVCKISFPELASCGIVCTCPFTCYMYAETNKDDQCVIDVPRVTLHCAAEENEPTVDVNEALIALPAIPKKCRGGLVAARSRSKLISEQWSCLLVRHFRTHF